jgi:hypothetical protein
LELRYQRIQLCPAKYHSDKDPIDIWVVHAVESAPPEGTEAVEWFLLTTIDMTSAEDAVRCLRWYKLSATGRRALNDARSAVNNLWRGFRWPLKGSS